MLDNCGTADADDELGHALPGAAMTHIFAVRSANDLATTIEILRRVETSGGCLVSLRSKSAEQQLDHRIGVTGLKASAARALAAELSDSRGVLHATVEHHLVRRLGRA